MEFTKRVTSVRMLKEMCKEQTQDFFINLGGARSSKDIAFDYDLNKFMIFNNIDDTEQLLNEDELFTESNIGEAIENGNFYKY